MADLKAVYQATSLEIAEYKLELGEYSIKCVK
jgi:hypothetical protein